MITNYYQKIALSTAHRKSREDNSKFIIQNPTLIIDLISIAFSINDKNHHKACWILELVCEDKIELFLPYLDEFCTTLYQFKSESSIRSISKICMFLVKGKSFSLTPFQEEKIIEACLDWLIGNSKVASKAYAMYTLSILSKKHTWLIHELPLIIDKDFSAQSPAYKAAAKDVLRKITR